MRGPQARAAAGWRRAAAPSVILQDELRELKSMINESGMESGRKMVALREVTRALAKLEKGDDPLSGLCPPPDCAPCHGATSGTHCFLCQKRRREPGALERTCRDRVVRKLSELRRASADVQVTCPPARPPARPPAPPCPARIELAALRAEL